MRWKFGVFEKGIRKSLGGHKKRRFQLIMEQKKKIPLFYGVDLAMAGIFRNPERFCRACSGSFFFVFFFYVERASAILLYDS